eukprot:CAMPEP_0202337594 /NCGR_PEP_ID=MMETSP1126-20121109/217_1 /ASSEMBLY_ACC=CAM_ASM_000457 /TAXON_ID=3047 /ORGANISM="Dunaliella tertiolecta, Strain CCMP1320" /LENGTH=226 /DNA_ID=CAMNT_0048927823 /DNA_START=61 /DNA_END=741 /DNA_ORIENTATION=+
MLMSSRASIVGSPSQQWQARPHLAAPRQRLALPPQAAGLSLPNPFALFGGNKEKQREEKKEELLAIIKPLKRGVNASDEDKAEVEAACRALEKLNPNPKALSCELINGKWELLYTTSDSILGINKPPPLRPSGPIYQTIDAVNGKARNAETLPFFNQVAADLTPMSANKVAVQFKQFKILGLIPITAPESAKGELATTYLDEELRISRGDKGNLFVLRMADPDGKP